MNSLHGTELVAARIESKVHAHLPAFRKIGDPLGTVFTDAAGKTTELVEFAGVPSESAAPYKTNPFEHVSVIHSGLWTIQCSETDIEQIAVGDDIIADQEFIQNIKLPGAKDPVTTFQLRKFNGNDIGPKPLSQNNAQSYRFTRHLIGRVYSRDFKSKTIECLLKTQCYHRQYDEYIADKRKFASTYCEEENTIQTNVSKFDDLSKLEPLELLGQYRGIKDTQNDVRAFLGINCGMPTEKGIDLLNLQQSQLENYETGRGLPSGSILKRTTQDVKSKTQRERIEAENTGAAAAPRRSRKREKATMSVRDATEAAEPAKKKK